MASLRSAQLAAPVAPPDAGSELASAREELAALREILRVVGASRASEQPVFDAIARLSLELCGAQSANVFTYDGQLLHIAALAIVEQRGVEAMHHIFPRPASNDSAACRAVLLRRIVVIPDVMADPDFVTREYAVAAKFRSVVGVPLLRDGEPIGAIAVGRSETGPFPDRQIALLEAFAEQAVIAIENTRHFRELQTRNRQLAEALEQQTATSDILRTISRSPGDVQPVFDTIVTAARDLCDARSAAVYFYDGRLLHVAALALGHPDADAALRRLFPRPLDRAFVASRAMLERSVVIIEDVRKDPEYEFASSADLGIVSVLGVPLLRDGEPVGGIGVSRPVPGPFAESQIALLRTFADQAVIALENARLFQERDMRNRELAEALETQTATSDILRVISRSTTDAQPVFDTIAAAALKLCGAASALVYRFDGALLHIGALALSDPSREPTFRAYFPRPPGPDTAVGRAVLTRRVAAIDDVTLDPAYSPELTSRWDIRSLLGVPLLRDGVPIGAVAVGRPEPGCFTEKQIALLQTFADQAVIAIENVRLFNETRQALERQTATAEVLRVISSSITDTQPVFDVIAERAARLTAAKSGWVFTYDGEWIHERSAYGLTPDGLATARALFPMRPGSACYTSMAIRDGQVMNVADALAETDPEYATKPVADAAGYRSVLSVPMFKGRQVLGALSVNRAEVGRFGDREVDLLRTFADQAVIAIENVRLFRELEARTEQLTRSVGQLRALAEVGQAVSSTLDVDMVLRTIVARATQLAGMDGGALYEFEPTRGEFRLHTADHLPDELVDALRAAPIRRGEGALGRMAVAGEPVAVHDIADSAAYRSRARDLLLRLGYRALLAVPLLREGRLLGGLVVNRSRPGEFEPDVVALLQTFATQSAIAIEHARLFRELEEKSRQLEVASRHKSAFLANMSHELRTPLNAIIGFTRIVMRRSQAQLEPKQFENLEKILASGQNLLTLINAILDLAKVEAGRIELAPRQIELGPLLEQCLRTIEPLLRDGVALRREFDGALPPMFADEDKLRQILINLLSNAAKFTSSGSLALAAHAAGGAVDIRVADTGIGIAADKLDSIFEEFEQADASSTREYGGTGLGLAIARRLARLMGGDIAVVSRPGAGSTFTLHLPLRSPTTSA